MKAFFRPCSGLIVKSFATLPAEKNFESHLAPSMEAYKKFRKMFVVDDSLGDFKGDN